jgi:hypothetical protein
LSAWCWQISAHESAAHEICIYEQGRLTLLLGLIKMDSFTR